ncbi:hypothetical protein Acr_28g0002640 [Actinidia rufa]|uniref:Retrotransposon gag domain-containing protein n=1 Tax=Actinidia rufa TaxID=165716 RepID=A0A7J0H922_9ERIC|nr:hypothetical protein Acr_28g0002640 [Actinidia rufa]
MDHLDLYKNLMALHGYSNEVMCKGFSATLKGSAKSWFRKLSPRTIDSFGKLSRLFVAKFMSYRVKNEEFVKWSEKIKTNPLKRNINKYYEFHKDHRHNTVDYFQLKEQIADLIKRGEASRRAEEEVYNLSSPLVVAHQPITFTNDDLRGLHLPHDDALVVSATIANFNMQRILVDNGSFVDILFISTFDKMKIGRDRLHPFHMPLVRFGGNATHPLGWIKLPLTLGAKLHQTIVWQDFIVVDRPSPYNVKAFNLIYFVRKCFLQMPRRGLGVAMWSLIVKPGKTKQVTTGSGLKTTGGMNSRGKQK